MSAIVILIFLMMKPNSERGRTYLIRMTADIEPRFSVPYNQRSFHWDSTAE